MIELQVLSSHNLLFLVVCGDNGDGTMMIERKTILVGIAIGIHDDQDDADAAPIEDAPDGDD